MNKQQHKELFDWALEQAALRYMNKLEQYKIDKLNSIGFDWVYYENELDKLGFHWEKNNPNGKRYMQTQQDKHHE